MVMTGRWMRKLCLTRLLWAVTKPWQTLIEQEPGAGESERWRRTVRMPNHFTLQTQQAHTKRNTHIQAATHTLSQMHGCIWREGKLISTQKGKKKTWAATNNKEWKQNKDQITVAQWLCKQSPRLWVSIWTLLSSALHP